MLDEADRLLNMDFEQELDQILKVIPKVRQPPTQGSDRGKLLEDPEPGLQLCLKQGTRGVG